MREIERKFLMDYVCPMLNRDNVIFFINMAFNKLFNRSEDPDPFEEDEDDDGDDDEEEDK